MPDCDKPECIANKGGRIIKRGREREREREREGGVSMERGEGKNNKCRERGGGV